jgi:biopolymer transport protein ExbD
MEFGFSSVSILNIHMAEMQSSETRNKKAGRRSKKLSTRVDLTPMVDLGFLLITFFIFTTTMAQAKSMRLILPSDEPVDTPMTVADSKTISLVLGDANKIFYYNGLNVSDMKASDYSSAGIRKVLQQKIKAVNSQFHSKGELVVLIKPTIYASYQNVIDILDEILINDIKRYVLMDVSKEEIDRLAPAPVKHP